MRVIMVTERLIEERFEAVAEDGRVFTLLKAIPLISTRTLSGEYTPFKEGLATISTIDGMHCNYIDADTFEVVVLGLRLKKL